MGQWKQYFKCDAEVFLGICLGWLHTKDSQQDKLKRYGLQDSKAAVKVDQIWTLDYSKL